MRRLPAAKKVNDAHRYVVKNCDTCNCPDFQRNDYPCKHVIKTWLSADGELVVPLVENQWWSVDNDVFHISTRTQHPTLSIAPPASQRTDIINDLQADDALTRDLTILEKQLASLPKKKSLASLNREIQETLLQLRDFKHLNKDMSTAEDILCKLQSMKALYHSTAKTMSNLPLLPTLPKQMPSRKRRLITIDKDTALKVKKQRPLRYMGSANRRRNFVVPNLTSCHSKKPIPDKRVSNVDKVPKRPADVIVNNNISKDILQPRFQLTSDEVLQGLKLIHVQWPNITTQDPVLIQTQNLFNMSPVLESSCQVLHMRTPPHWVAVRNVGAPSNQVRYFDSLGLSVTLRVAKAVASKLSKQLRFSAR